MASTFDATGLPTSKLNLRLDRGGSLFDSRENNRQVRSWDGLDLRYDFENISLYGFGYIISEDRDGYGTTNTAPVEGSESRDAGLYGLYLTWEPEQDPLDSMYLVGGATYENNVRDDLFHAERDADIGDNLLTYYIGAEYDQTRSTGLDYYAEFAAQEGDASDTANLQW